MRKMKKGISAMLAFVMLMSAMLCNMVMSVSAAETTLIAKGEFVNYTFSTDINDYNSGITLPYKDSGNVVEEYNSSDGYVSMTGGMTCNYTTSSPANAHGLYFKEDSDISFTVEGDATITLGLCLYNDTKEKNIEVSATTGVVTL